MLSNCCYSNCRTLWWTEPSWVLGMKSWIETTLQRFRGMRHFWSTVCTNRVGANYTSEAWARRFGADCIFPNCLTNLDTCNKRFPPRRWLQLLIVVLNPESVESCRGCVRKYSGCKRRLNEMGCVRVLTSSSFYVTAHWSPICPSTCQFFWQEALVPMMTGMQEHVLLVL